MRNRLLALPLLFTIVSACSGDSELSETLSWMDNTYNPHEGVTLAFGHGRTGWYAPKDDSAYREYLVNGSTETFTYDRCKMTLHFEDNRADATHRDIHSSSSSSFNLHDINPQSIKLSTYSHTGGFRCEGHPLREQMDCDHAEIVFSTHSEAPLIDDETDTIYEKLQGSDHENKHSSKSNHGHFQVDDVEYAGRLAEAFRHAVELCGGKPEPF
jgi:hypothetical protein